MKTMSHLLLVGAIAWGLAPMPAAAQNQEDCRCVDRDGNAIENCTCFRAPRLSGMVMNMDRSLFGRPRLGVSVSVNQSASDDSRGALVTDVMDDGPAEEAGLREGDIITSVDGHSLLESLGKDAEDDFDLDRSVPVQRLFAIARKLEPEQEVEVRYLRGDEERTTTLTTEDLSDWGDFTVMGRGLDTEALRDRMGDLRLRLRKEDAPAVADFSFFGRGRVAGLELAEMNPALGAYFSTDEGVLVLDVDEDSTLGLEAGDVILEIDGRKASTPSRVRRILGSYGDDEEITFRLVRGGSEMNVAGHPSG
jgi:PDZ domain